MNENNAEENLRKKNVVFGKWNVPRTQCVHLNDNVKTETYVCRIVHDTYMDKMQKKFINTCAHLFLTLVS